MKSRRVLASGFFLLVLAVVITVSSLAQLAQSLREMEANLDNLRLDAQKQVGAVRQRLDRQADLLMRPGAVIPYSDLQAITVRVDVGDNHGTGVLVTRQLGDVKRTYVWTAGHVARCVRQGGTFGSIVIYQEHRENGKYIDTVETDAKVIAYSDSEKGDDLALLEVLKDNFTTVSATFNLSDPLVGTEVVHVGCTLGLYNSVSLGIISQTDRDMLKTGAMFDQTSCMGYPGSSGGGVYMKDGNCVGLLVRGAGPGLNFIVPVRRMLAWAKRMKIEWALDPSVKMPTRVVRDETLIDDGTGGLSDSEDTISEVSI